MSFFGANSVVLGLTALVCLVWVWRRWSSSHKGSYRVMTGLALLYLAVLYGGVYLDAFWRRSLIVQNGMLGQFGLAILALSLLAEFVADWNVRK